MFRMMVYIGVGILVGYLMRRRSDRDGGAPIPSGSTVPAVEPVVETTNDDISAREAGSPPTVSDSNSASYASWGGTITTEEEEPDILDLIDSEDEVELDAPSTIMDDLTVIKGIGPTFAMRLQEAGLRSIADIAAATAEDLQQITQVRAWQRPNAEEWIAEAKQLQ